MILKMSKQTNNLDKFKCPNCNRTGQYIKEEHETFCECGLVIIASYPYTAGQRFKTISDYQIEEQERRTDKKWKRTISQLMRLGQQ